MEPPQSQPPAPGRVLVRVSPAAESNRLIQIARELAASRNAALTVLYVGTQEPARATEDFGTQVVTLSGGSVGSAPEEVVRYAREHRATQIVIGKPGASGPPSCAARWRIRSSGAAATGTSTSMLSASRLCRGKG